MNIIIPQNKLDIIKEEVPQKIRAKIVSIIENGYRLAKEYVKTCDFLNWEIGEMHLGYLRPIAIQYLFKNAIEQGKLPFTCTIESNSRKTAKYLQLHTKSAIITISQVQTPNQIARHAYFRQKMQQANQLRFDYFGDYNDSLVKGQPHYLLLTHGYGSDLPSFINLGLPNGKGWIERINLLMEPRLIEQDTEKANEEIIKRLIFQPAVFA